MPGQLDRRTCPADALPGRMAAEAHGRTGEDTQMKRTVFGVVTAAALAIASLASTPANAGGELHVLNWQGYGTDEAWAVKMFEERSGVKVVHDYFNSEQEMLTKLRTSPGTYDVVLINSAFTAAAAAEGVLQPVDPSKIANFGDLNPTLRDSPLFVVDGKLYGVAWVWGMTSVAYNTGTITERPDSIEVLWDPKYAGRVGWRDDAVESVSMAAIATGQDMNHPADLDKVREKLMALKSQIKTFWSSEDEWNKYFAAKDFDLAVYWSGSAARSKTNSGLPVGFVVPKEGAIGWFDGLSIAKDAPNADAAHAFINFMVEPEFYVQWATTVGAPASANMKANQGLPEGDMGREIHSDEAAIERLQFMAPLSDEERAKYQELWDEAKASFAK
jgi:spermidine/putrescine transport system substrate-binding protein